MNTKQFQPTFQMVANTISEINISNTLINVSDSADLERTFSLDLKKLEIEEHNTYKSAGLDVQVNVLIEEKAKESKKSFSLNMVIQGVFVDEKDISNEDFENKLKLNGVAALFSIARGCITNISAQCLAEGKIILPLVNFMDFAKSKS